MKKILIIFLFLSACGYQPLYNSNLKKIEFSKINLSGDIRIGREIISSLNIKEVNNNANKEISIESSQSIKVTSKNAQGQPSTYRTNVSVLISIKDQGKPIKSKLFSEDFTYNNIENKYDLSVYQKDIQNNLIKKIIDDLVVYINL
tara:strand:+ start:79 stop:516 length:438 start_codon:yes stop_codon:yes gene_type:complete